MAGSAWVVVTCPVLPVSTELAWALAQSDLFVDPDRGEYRNNWTWLGPVRTGNATSEAAHSLPREMQAGQQLHLKWDG